LGGNAELSVPYMRAGGFFVFMRKNNLSAVRAGAGPERRTA
jgi:hypothetical protein